MRALIALLGRGVGCIENGEGDVLIQQLYHCVIVGRAICAIKGEGYCLRG